MTAKVSDSQKAAMQTGRVEANAIRAYLSALEDIKPKRGRTRTVESINKRLKVINESLPDASPIDALNLRQERVNLLQEIDLRDSAVEIDDLEKKFIKHASSYSERKGISRAVWREAGVPSEVLTQAGI